MDRYVLVVTFLKGKLNKDDSNFIGLGSAKLIYDFVKNANSASETKLSPFPACSTSGAPALQRWYFAMQAFHGSSQFCSSEWEELGAGSQKSDSEEIVPSAMEACHSALQSQEEEDRDPVDSQSQAELYEEAAEGLQQLSDKLPPPGKALLDVIVLASGTEVPGLKEFLPVVGSLKHMQGWHSAKVAVVTENSAGWQKIAAYLLANICGPDKLLACIDEKELWRGNVLIREKKFVSEVQFGGFCLKDRPGDAWSSVLSADTVAQSYTDQKMNSEVFQYYRPVLDLVQLVAVSNLPIFLHSCVEFDLALTTKSAKSKLLMGQLRSLRGKVGALFSLSCVVSTLAAPPAAQVSSQKWKELMARRPKSLPVPDVEVKGENGQYFLLVQGAETGGCTARMLNSANQINGAAALATANGLLREKTLSRSGEGAADWLRSLPCLHGDQLIRRERKLAKVQTLALKECLRRREGALKPASVPVNDLKVLLGLAREHYLKMHDSSLPRAAPLILAKENCAQAAHMPGVRPARFPECPERSALQNFENQIKTRQRMRSSLILAGGSSECLLGPKDGQRVPSAPLDAKELLKHFTPEGLPSGELQPLLVLRGENAFQMSPDLTPRKVTQLPFSKATSSHYHGIEFCLDERKALERDRGFVKLQTRLVRYETQTTCSKEPCPLPFALSPAPSPAVLSEPGSVPDGETLLSGETRGDVPRLKRRSWDTDGSHVYKRLAKSESSDSLGSQCSSGSGAANPVVRALRRQASRSQSISAAPGRGPEPQQHAGDNVSKESRSQKHHRMLKEVVVKTLKERGITSEHKCFEACSQRLFEISKFYLKDLKTSRGLHEEMKKAASSNSKQVIDWVLEKASKN